MKIEISKREITYMIYIFNNAKQEIITRVNLDKYDKKILKFMVKFYNKMKGGLEWYTKFIRQTETSYG